jgi:hypothetical protein
MKYFKNLKSKWNIQSNWQIFIILLVFSITGLSAVFARTLVFNLLGITESDPFWLKSVVWLLTILPLYNIFLLLYGALFGQFEFFWGFFKKMMRRFIPWKSTP